MARAYYHEAKKVKKYYDLNYAKRNPSNPKRGQNWSFVLAAYGYPELIEPDDHDEAVANPMTAESAFGRCVNWKGWYPIAKVLERVEAEAKTEDVEAEEYRAIEEAGLDVEDEDEVPANTAPAFPWTDWEETIDLSPALFGVGPALREAFARVGVDESSASWMRRQALAWKLWESVHPPVWASRCPVDYAKEGRIVEEVIGGDDLPTDWIGTGPKNVEEWYDWQSAGMGGVRSLYVLTLNGKKYHFPTKERRDAFYESWKANTQ